MPSVVENAEQIARSYGNNHRDAWRECNKRLRKNPKDLTSGLWRLRLLSKDDPAEKYLEACSEFCKLSIDFETLSYVHLLTHDVRERSGPPTNTVGPDVQNAWFRRTDADPDRRAPGYYHLFESAYACKHWKDSQVAVSKLRAKHPDRHDFYFTYVAVSQLASESDAERDTKMGEMDRKLAYMFASQALQGIKKPSAKVKVVDPRQLRLAVQIMRRQGRQDELLDLLDDPDIGIAGAVANNDWEFVRVKIEILEQKSAWSDLYHFCRGLLREESSHFADASGDWAVWHGLARSAIETGDSSLLNDLRELYETWKTTYPDDWRNAWLAYTKAVIRAGDDHVGDALPLCKEYFVTYGTLYRAFHDLGEIVARLSATDQQHFRQIREDHGRSLASGDGELSEKAYAKWMICQVTNLKLDYLAFISQDDNVTVELLEEFVRTAVRLHRQPSGTEHNSSQECALIAVIALVRLHEQDETANPGSQRYLLQAMQLLSALLLSIRNDDNIPNNRYIGLVLTIVALRLGLGSFAAGPWAALRVKDALSESLAHFRLTRISTSHPFAAPTAWGPPIPSHLADPAELLTRTLESYTAAAHRLRAYEQTDTPGVPLLDIQYDALLELDAYASSLTHSISRSMWIFERHRLARLRAGRAAGSGARTTRSGDVDDTDALPRAWLRPDAAADHRDRACLPTLAPPGARPSFADSLVAEPHPARYWLSATALAEEVHAILHGELAAPTHPRRRVYAAARAHLAAAPPDSRAAELTPAERATLDAWVLLWPLAVGVASASTIYVPDDADLALLADTSVDADLHRAAAVLVARLDAVHVLRPSADSSEPASTAAVLPGRELLQTLFLHLDLVAAAQRAADLCAAALKAKKTHPLKSRASAGRVEGLAGAASTLHAAVLDVAAAWREWLAGEIGWERIAAEIGKGATGEVVMDGSGGVEGVAKAMRDSAVEAVGGVFRVKMG